MSRGSISEYEIPTETLQQLLRQRQETSADGVVKNSTGPVPESDDSDEPLPEPLFNRFNRRKSVFAESYDPEAADDDDHNVVEKVICSKSIEQRQRKAEAAKNIFIFRSLDQEQIDKILDAMFERMVECGEYVIRQGDDGDNFYVIDSGVYHVFVASDSAAKQVGHYDGSGSFGELALMYNTPRAATIQAVTQGTLWAMDGATFRRTVLKTACKKRKMYESLLETVPMLGALTPYQRMNLVDALNPRQFDDEACIFRQGDAADGMYFIEAGTVRITVIGDGGVQVEVNRVTKGGYFGELALLNCRPRAASAYSVGSVRSVFLDLEAFERLLGPCMDVMKRNIDHYEEELVTTSHANVVSDLP